jgi:hypothetical protein
VGDFSVLQSIQAFSGDLPASNQMGAEGYFPRNNNWGVKLTSELSLLPKLDIPEVVLPVFHTSSRRDVYFSTQTTITG